MRKSQEEKQVLYDRIKLLYSELKSTRSVVEALSRDGIEISQRTVQRAVKGTTETDQLTEVQSDSLPFAGGTVLSPDKNRPWLAGKRFVFTSAQNNTYVHEGFLASLLHFCKHKDAQLVVSTFTYNKSGFQNGTKDSDELWFDHRIKDHIVDTSVQVADDLIFCGELDILPTAADPLSGLYNYAYNNSGIVPHAKVALRSLPRIKGEDPRFLYTTGSITLRNYIQRKAGQKAEFHHVFGALYVEINDDGEWFARQLVACSDGSFCDLDLMVTPDGITEGHSVSGLQLGDIHIERIDQDVLLGAGDMIQSLTPDYIFVHDLTDFYTRNHHNIKDPYFLAEMMANGNPTVEDGMQLCAEFLAQLSTSTDTEVIVVESNHDLAFKKWLREADIKTDPVNAKLWHLYNFKIHNAIQSKDKRYSPFEDAIRAQGWWLDNVRFLREDDSFLLHDIECGMHGHLGPNGARGNPRNLRNIGRKVNIGHVHSAEIVDGVYAAGISCQLDMGYNKGPSAWSHSHILTYKNGKRSIITMRGSKWKA